MCSRLQVLSKTLKFQIRGMGRLRPRLSIFYDKKQPFSVNVFQAKVCTQAYTCTVTGPFCQKS